MLRMKLNYLRQRMDEIKLFEETNEDEVKLFETTNVEDEIKLFEATNVEKLRIKFIQAEIWANDTW